MANTTIDLLGYKTSEQIYAGTRTVVYRGFRSSDRQPVVIKLLRNEFPRFNELVHFRNQYIIAKNLDLPGIVKTYSLENYHNRYALIQEDFGGISLGSYFAAIAEISKDDRESSSLRISEFLPIAISIADTLDGLTRHRVIHKDLKPANILINPTTKKVKLIDFSIASLLPLETQVLHNPNVLEGTLPYISPEQTGRMNRGIDYRTDFYSLGVTFYELLAGQLPFQSNDPMDLVHCHLAKEPVPLHHLNKSIPRVLSEIVSFLMAKNAEERYQSALGLKHDLEICQQQWKEKRAIAYFKLAERDLSDRFIIPENLYGREAEVQTLLSAFDRVSAGSSEMMLVAGFSGIGKTAVVNEVHKPIVRQRGYFIKGKFDQMGRNLPFSAFVQAFRDLMAQLLSETDAKIEQWKSEILAALGESAGAIVEVIPELELLIGEQPPVPELTGSAAQNRFNLLFQKFIHVFTTNEHPLVIFLDDLQWADSASLKLMQLLISDLGSRYLFLIGAYRDNEVFPAHPLMLALADIQKGGATTNTITLAPLQQSDVNCLIADTLGCSKALAQPLAEQVYQKTKGNPFFATQFLKSLHEDGLISFNFEARHWECDIAKVRALALTDDVVEFVALQLRKLPAATQEVLKLAACIGNQFDLATLAIVAEKSPEETASNLWKALQEVLILPITEVYKFYQDSERGNSAIAPVKDSGQLSSTDDRSAKYRFLHDRVQQAAYSLIPEEQKRSSHLKIGQRLLNNSSETEREERIFDIVNHLNVGLELITQLSKRDELARLNLAAGKKAKAATANSAAAEYFKVGRELLTADSWESQYNLTLALHEEAAEAAYLNGDFDQMERLANLVFQQAMSLLDKVKVYEVQLQAYMAQNKLQEALNTGLPVLKQLGVEFPSEPNPSDIEQALTQTASILSGKRTEDLIDLPQMTDPHQLATIRILSCVFLSAYMALPPLVPLMVSKQVDLSVQHGNSSVSAFAYTFYALFLCGVGDIEGGYQFGQLALRLVSKLNAKEIQAKTSAMVHSGIQPWKEHLRNTLEPLRSAYSFGLETGELEYAGYAICQYSYNSYFVGKPLTHLEREIAVFTDSLRKINHEAALNYTKICWQAVLNLIGRTQNPCQLKGEAYDEETMLQLYQRTSNYMAIHYFHLHKLLLCYVFEDYPEAFKNIAQIETCLSAASGLITVTIFYFYDSLVRLAVYPHTPQSEQQDILNRVQANLEKMQKWAHHAPMNHQHKYYLVEAERHRVLGENVEAMEMYDNAIALAKENEYVNEEAVANELAAKFYLGWGKQKIAKTYLIDAYYAYARWGAKAKIDDLEKRYPQLLASILQQNNSSQHEREIGLSSSGISSISSTGKTITSSAKTVEMVDLPTVIKASQVVSGEIQLDQLLSTLMQEAIKNAGAQTGALILNEEDSWKIAVHCPRSKECHLESISIEESKAFPFSVINYVKRTKETLVFDNASAQPSFASDPYIIQQQPKSLLCSTIRDRGKLLGILYLENNLTTGVFTRDRLLVLNVLTSQAAISIENARLYQKSQDYAQQLEHSLQDKTRLLAEVQEAQLQLIQSEKMSALGQLVAGIAHEINNPVGFISGNLTHASEYIQDLLDLLNLYQERCPTSDPDISEKIEEIDLNFLVEDLPDLISSMKEGTDRIRNISTSLRTFSRSDTSAKVNFNIHEGIDSTLLILKHRLKANNSRPEIEIIKEYGDLPQVECYPGQLNQVFMNIIANAIDALEEGKSEWGIENGKNNRPIPNPRFPIPTIRIKTEIERSNNWAIVRIKDNGSGMPEEVKERIFERLFTTKAVGKGTGLGLSISRQIVVEKHGGQLTCISEQGLGTEFAIALPIQEAP